MSANFIKTNNFVKDLEGERYSEADEEELAADAAFLERRVWRNQMKDRMSIEDITACTAASGEDATGGEQRTSFLRTAASRDDRSPSGGPMGFRCL
jgi:hypothetical protein